ncbi:thioesterase II family protein [Chitiniphilus eburneus]|nr:alpha/beta fold hydrolase [Chitiniphilus eburneus]
MTTERYVLLSHRHPGRAGSPDVPVRLVAYGFAGGTVTALLPLLRHLPPGIEVWGAEYPGRGLRWREPLLDRAADVIDDLLPGLQRLADRPLALLGYSMGAHFAYRLSLAAAFAPLGLVAISARAPGGVVVAPSWSELDDSDLLRRLRALGGMPDEVLENPVMRDAFLPVVRADLACCRSLERLPVRPAPCPVLALRGDADPLLTPSDPAQWLALAPRRANATRRYPAGHFIHPGREAQVASDIATWLARATSPATDHNPALLAASTRR